MPKITELVSSAEAEKDDEAAVKKLLQDAFRGLPQEFEMELLDMPDIGWKCDCSEERLEQVVLSLGAKEIRNIIDEDGEAELTCQFCRKRYRFDGDHLKRLLYESIRQKMN